VIEMAARRIMIVANQTASGPHLKQIVSERVAEGPCTFVLLVPVTPPKGTWTFTDDEALELARGRMQQALDGLRDLDAQIEGHVEVGAPLDAVDAYLDSGRYENIDPFDEIILSTLPPGVSRWLKQDLPHRLERHHEIPVTHVIGEDEAG
jgi:hypothetical protein